MHEVRFASGDVELAGTLRLPAGTRGGRVTESYTYFAEEMPPSCPAGAKVLGYPVRWTIAGKGEIHFAVAERSDCLLDAFTADQEFTITGGTGIYAGASGGGQVDRTLTQTAAGAEGSESWIGTLTVPGLEFDLTAPTITGARSKTVRAPPRAARVRVAYSLSATDDVDGRLPVVCRPPSGTRFRIGRTTVRCTATDNSGNVASATFRITVLRR
jgi:hypothetical protein